jgi:hypothetical protein
VAEMAPTAKRLSSPTRALLGVVIVATLILLGSASQAQAAGPEWEVHATHEKDTFLRGPEPVKLFSPETENTWTINIVNSGDTVTESPYKVTVTLPEGVRVERGPGFPWSCPAPAAMQDGVPFTCEAEEFFPWQVQPGESAPTFTMFVEVASGTPDTITYTAKVFGGGATAVTVTDPTPVEDIPPFHVKSFLGESMDAAEAKYTVAGGHPYLTVNEWLFPRYPNEQMKDASVTLPPGFFGNPSAAPRCPMSAIAAAPVFGGEPNCPPGSKIGEMGLGIFGSYTPIYRPAYNVVPDRGYPAQFVVNVLGTLVSLYTVPLPRSEKYGLAIGSTNATRISIKAFGAKFWGVPSEHGSGTSGTPFLSNPVDCSDPEPSWNLALDSWEHPGLRSPVTGFPDLTDPTWVTGTDPASPMTGCDDPALTSQFHPGIDVKPAQEGAQTQADQPAGLNVALDFPQTNDPTDLSTNFDASLPQAPEPKDITIKLPAGVSLSPASADGLSACSDLASDPVGDQVHYDSTKPVTCPDASIVGTATTTTPLLARRDPVDDAVTGPEPIRGDVYLIKPHPGDLSPRGDQDGTFRLLIQLESARYGINFKLPGTAVADKATGQLTATFLGNPQLPASTLDVNLRPGPRAPLATPPICGDFATTSRMVPWSTPGTPDATLSASFAVNSGPNGTACASSPAGRPFSPSLNAGTESAGGGQSGPFVLNLERRDGEQELSTIDVTMPKGFTAALKGIPYCSDAAIATAAGRTGAAEQSNPSCPAATRIGTVNAAAGAGANPFPTPGNSYLAGPYKGAPLSLAFITPALAGPFDLGTIVVRAAVFVDPETAQVRIKADPLPTILDGVPLRLRSIMVRIDRPGFSINPTSCDVKSIDATIGSANGATATPSDGFQAAGCDELGFAPKLSLKLSGSTKRLGHPVLKAMVTYPKGAYANIASAAIALPKAEFLDNSHIGTVCTRVQFAVHACPAASIYGFARATTPLLDGAVEGPVYLRSSSNKLPDLVADLNGQIEVVLSGRIDTNKTGGIRNTFEAVPDVPVTEFTLELEGGKKGLLENSENVCKKPQRAAANFTAHNGKVLYLKPLVGNDCKKSKKTKRSKKKKKSVKRSGR